MQPLFWKVTSWKHAQTLHPALLIYIYTHIYIYIYICVCICRPDIPPHTLEGAPPCSSPFPPHTCLCLHAQPTCANAFAQLWLHSHPHGCIHIRMVAFTSAWLHSHPYGCIHIRMVAFTWLHSHANCTLTSDAHGPELQLHAPPVLMHRPSLMRPTRRCVTLWCVWW